MPLQVGFCDWPVLCLVYWSSVNTNLQAMLLYFPLSEGHLPATSSSQPIRITSASSIFSAGGSVPQAIVTLPDFLQLQGILL